jgi:site-specific DNA recombinase
MKRAKLEERVMGQAPKGYKNIRNERGIASISSSIHAELMKGAFLALEQGSSNQAEIRKNLKENGLEISKTRFSCLIRNPLYCGLISIVEENGEQRLIKAQHEGLISHEVFNNVQQILDGKRIHPLKYNAIVEQLPLRGFLKCPRCGKNMTGSASKGRHGGKFYYYHCGLGCPERQKAKVVNEGFIDLLSEIQSKSGVLNLYYEIIEQVFKESHKSDNSEMHKKDEDIKKNVTTQVLSYRDYLGR